MEKLNRSQIDIMGIGKVLTEGKLLVPQYQRSYSWEEKHIRDLLEDINLSIRDNKEDYFLGSIVIITDSKGNKEVVDGQQRLATTSIILAAIRDYLLNQKTEDDKQRADIIEKKYLFTKDFNTLEMNQNIQLNIEDNLFFCNSIIARDKGKKIDPTKDSHIKLNEAYKKIKDFLDKDATSNGKETEQIRKWVDYLENNIVIICIQVADYSYAYTIFETLNDRGLDLTVSDLLKNLLFSRADNKINIIQSNWTQMISYLESVNKEGLKVDFIRHFWASRNGLTRERELYSKIRDKINTTAQALDFSNDLVFASYSYIGLLNPESEIWDSYGAQTKQNILVLNMLGMQQNRPLLLAIIEKFEKKNVILSIKNLLSWAVRFIITGRLGSSALENNFAENAKLVSSNKIVNIFDLYESMKNIIPTDEEFIDSFKLFQLSRHDLARYILQEIEIAKSGEAQPEFVPNNNPLQVNLEHILPKKFNNSWKHFTEEEHRVFHKRVGNLCLIKERINSSIGSKSFDEKKEFYKNSMYYFTKQLYTNLNWDKKAIENRQLEMAKVAIKVWKMKYFES